MAEIVDIEGRKVLDSRGNPTTEADVILDNGVVGSACASSGTLIGSREALELCDGDRNRYLDKGVLKAVANINGLIRNLLSGKGATNQKALDHTMIELGGTENEAEPGANAILAVFLATAKAAAQAEDVPLHAHVTDLNGTSDQCSMPVSMMNIINGGKHADNNIDIQEFIVQPVGAKDFAEALRMGVKVLHHLRAVLKARGLNTAVGDEGGLVPNLLSNEDALAVTAEAAEKAGYKLGDDVTLTLDCASSGFFKDGGCDLEGEGRVFDVAGSADYLAGLTQRYPVIFTEDGMDKSDWAGWEGLTGKTGAKVQLVDDNLFMTDTEILKEGIEKGIGNSILIKFNQIDSFTETLEAIQMAKVIDCAAVVPYHSGKTENSTIVDLAVGTAADQIKTGPLCHSDRVSKYNQLLHIEEQLDARAPYRDCAEFHG